MATYKYKHLTLDDRIGIQKGLKEGMSFVEIAASIGKDPSTISKEIRGHLTEKETGTRSRPFNPCAGRKICTAQRKVCAECQLSLYDWHNRDGYCSLCGRCNDSCPDFIEETCKTLSKPPYVCNGCSKMRSCTLRKQVYDAKEAQRAYEEKRRDSRIGVDLTPEELKRLDDIITPLIQQGQSIHQICANNADEIMCDERSIYNYVDAGILSVGNIDLPRKVRYRKRRKRKTVHIDKLCHIGRTYEDFRKFMETHPDLNVVEMDSVEGTKDSLKVLLTLFFRNSSLMLAILREANTARSVTDIFNTLYDTLGGELFRKLFPVILTDRGSEFTDPAAIEFDRDGNRRTFVFYCDPQRSSQKGSIEVTHEFIRRILPKGTSFKALSQDKVDRMMSHINSYSRKKLNDRSAYQMFSFFYGRDTLDALHIQDIDANEITLKPELMAR